MNSEFVVIQPFIETISKTITQYKIIVQDLVLFKSVSIRLDCFDSNNLYVKSKDIIIEGEENNNRLNDKDNKILDSIPPPQIDSQVKII